jgi:hypothetical protein
MKRFLMLLALPAFLGGGYAHAACADFGGTWERNDGVAFSLTQNGCVVSGWGAHATGERWSNRLVANITGTTGIGSIDRTDSVTGCRTIMNVRMTHRTDGQIEIAVMGTDGACELSATYSENYVYSRK